MQNVEQKEIGGSKKNSSEIIKKRSGALDMDSMRERDRQKVKGKFIFHEAPGATMSFVYNKYKGDPIERYDLKDGEIYSLPLGVAKHLNKGCWYPEHSYLEDEEGKVSQRVGRKVRRCSFQSLEFIEDADLEPVESHGIVSVEAI